MTRESRIDNKLETYVGSDIRGHNVMSHFVLTSYS